METPDPSNDTPGALKQVVLTPHDIPWRLRVGWFFRKQHTVAPSAIQEPIHKENMEETHESYCT